MNWTSQAQHGLLCFTPVKNPTATDVMRGSSLGKNAYFWELYKVFTPRLKAKIPVSYTSTASVIFMSLTIQEAKYVIKSNLLNHFKTLSFKPFAQAILFGASLVDMYAGSCIYFYCTLYSVLFRIWSVICFLKAASWNASVK